MLTLLRSLKFVMVRLFLELYYCCLTHLLFILVVVAFGEDIPKDEVQKFTTMIERIKGRVYSSSSLFSSEITHVVSLLLHNLYTILLFFIN